MGNLCIGMLGSAFAHKCEVTVIEDVFDGFGIKDRHTDFVVTESAREVMRTILSYAVIAVMTGGVNEQTIPLLVEKGSRFFNIFDLFAAIRNALKIDSFNPDLVPETLAKEIEENQYSDEIGSAIEVLDRPGFLALMGYLGERECSYEWKDKALRRDYSYHFLRWLEREETPAMVIAIMNASLADADMSDKEFEMRKITHAINAAFFCGDTNVVYGLFGGRQATYPRDVGHEGGGDNKAPCEEGGYEHT